VKKNEFGKILKLAGGHFSAIQKALKKSDLKTCEKNIRKMDCIFQELDSKAQNLNTTDQQIDIELLCPVGEADYTQIYLSFIETVDISHLITKISQKIAADIGYENLNLNKTEKSLLQKLVEEEGLQRSNALKTIRNGMENFCRLADIGSSFQSFIFLVCGEKLGLFNSNNNCFSEEFQLAIRWLSGEKISDKERKQIGIFEKLDKKSARNWLCSLFRLMRLSEKTGAPIDHRILNSIIKHLKNIHYQFVSQYQNEALKDQCQGTA